YRSCGRRSARATAVGPLPPRPQGGTAGEQPGADRVARTLTAGLPELRYRDRGGFGVKSAPPDAPVSQRKRSMKSAYALFSIAAGARPLPRVAIRPQAA